MKKHMSHLPVVVALVGAVLMAISIFLPYSSATKEYAENLNAYPDVVIYEDLDMTAKDIVDMSMVEYATVYSELSEELWGDASNGAIYVTLVVLIGGFALLTALFAALKKPIATAIFGLLSFGVFSLQNVDYTDRGVVPSSSYEWGFGYYLFFIAIALVVVGSIWMLVSKIRNKRENAGVEVVRNDE